MISIKDAVDQLAVREQFQQEQLQQKQTQDAIAAYRQAVEQTQLHIFPLFPRAGQARQSTVRQILLQVDASPSAIAVTIGPWSATLQDFAQDAEASRARSSRRTPTPRPRSVQAAARAT